MKPQKIIGWLLLFTGLIIIFYSIFASYNIFTGKALEPTVFKTSEKEAVLPQKGKVQTQEAQMQEMIGGQLKEMLPVDFIPKLLNLLAWSIMAGIMIFAGTQISSLGIKLIKR
ncbi:MAG: hypothetical protein ACKKMS_01740 [Candidatus Nealsonbacteria bacterium]